MAEAVVPPFSLALCSVVFSFFFSSLLLLPLVLCHFYSLYDRLPYLRLAHPWSDPGVFAYFVATAHRCCSPIDLRRPASEAVPASAIFLRQVPTHQYRDGGNEVLSERSFHFSSGIIDGNRECRHKQGSQKRCYHPKPHTSPFRDLLVLRKSAPLPRSTSIHATPSRRKEGQERIDSDALRPLRLEYYCLAVVCLFVS